MKKNVGYNTSFKKKRCPLRDDGYHQCIGDDCNLFVKAEGCCVSDTKEKKL